MTLVATLLVVSATIAVVLWPLFRARPAPDAGQSWERNRLEALLARRDSAYDAIRDLDFEYRLGNLAEADYLELRERYRERAAGVLRRLDRLDRSSPSAREADLPMVQRIAETGDLALPVCTHCGGPVGDGDAYCRHCGKPLEVKRET